jgi:hypothetical protein
MKRLKLIKKIFNRRLQLVSAVCLITPTILFRVELAFSAEPIWHCSRSVLTNMSSVGSQSASTDKKEDLSFDLSESDTIEISTMDLFRTFSGDAVFLGSKRLSGCFIDRNNWLSEQAMNMIDIELAGLVALSQGDSIVLSKVFPVRSEEQMKICIKKHHPAVGYLSQVVENEAIGPCF